MIKIDPKELSARLKTANEEASTGFQNLQDGSAYHMVLDKVELGQSKAGNPMVIHHCQVLAGDFQGKTHRIFSLLNNDVSLRIMLQMWRSLGLDTDQVDSVDMIKAACEQITKERFQFIASVLTNEKGFQNTRILSLVAPTAKPAPVASVASVTTAKPKPAPVSAPVVAEVEVEVMPTSEVVVEEEFSIEIGTKIAFTFKKEAMKGAVTELDEENSKVKVLSDNGKTYLIATSSITGPA